MRSAHALRCVMILAAVMLAPALAAAEPTCDASSLTGAFGFHLTGTNTQRSALYAIVGRFEADGKGVLIGSATHSVQGAITRVKFTGTYTVNADCTGTSRITFPNDITAGLDFVLTSDLNEFFIIDLGQGNIESGSGRRQFTAPQTLTRPADHREPRR
jgi:hypothetical protein